MTAPAPKSAQGTARAPDTPDVLDRFEQDVPVGRVVNQGGLRGGKDTYGVLSVDNGALRISPVLDPGWGSTSVAYGPYERRPGLAFAVFMLNGHNTAQSEHISDTYWRRLRWWWDGSFTHDRKTRLKQLWESGRVRRTLRLFRWWFNLRQGRRSLKTFDENLAVGFFPEKAPKRPTHDGNGFVMHATGPENGELWAGVNGQPAPSVTGVQNLPMYYVVVLREQGAAYYAAAIPGSPLLPDYPSLRPLSIDSTCTASPLHAVISQATSGQIGFRIDSRVYGARVVQIPELERWYGTAHAADTLTGEGALQGRDADRGGSWAVSQGRFLRSADGAVPADAEANAALRVVTDSGLVHAQVQLGGADTQVDLLVQNGNRGVSAGLTLAAGRCALFTGPAGARRELAASTVDGGTHGFASVQLLVGPKDVRAIVDGKLIATAFAASLEKSAGESTVGFAVRDGNTATRIKLFEAHPDRVPLPAQLDMGTIKMPRGERVVVTEDFDGPAGSTLEGKTTTTGGRKWRRRMGTGEIDMRGDNAGYIRATKARPNPDRTSFTIDWDPSKACDLEVEIQMPGKEMGDGAEARAGFMLYQDPNNYITINIYRSDYYPAASVSVFFQVDGFEDIYDAVWANVGTRANYGQRFRFRMILDGTHFLALMDDEPVLYRRLSDVYPHFKRLNVNEAGFIINWEWGHDTGSVLRKFVARA